MTIATRRRTRGVGLNRLRTSAPADRPSTSSNERDPSCGAGGAGGTAGGWAGGSSKSPNADVLTGRSCGGCGGRAAARRRGARRGGRECGRAAPRSPAPRPPIGAGTVMPPPPADAAETRWSPRWVFGGIAGGGVPRPRGATAGTSSAGRRGRCRGSPHRLCAPAAEPSAPSPCAAASLSGASCGPGKGPSTAVSTMRLGRPVRAVVGSVAVIVPHGSSSRTSSAGLCGPSSLGPSVTVHRVSRSFGTPGTDLRGGDRVATHQRARGPSRVPGHRPATASARSARGTAGPRERRRRSWWSTVRRAGPHPSAHRRRPARRPPPHRPGSRARPTAAAPGGGRHGAGPPRGRRPPRRRSRAPGRQATGRAR